MHILHGRPHFINCTREMSTGHTTTMTHLAQVGNEWPLNPVQLHLVFSEDERVLESVLQGANITRHVCNTEQRDLQKVHRFTA